MFLLKLLLYTVFLWMLIIFLRKFWDFKNIYEFYVAKYSL